MPSSHKIKSTEVKALREKLHAKQEGKCALCRCQMDSDYTVLDHDHTTGRVRAAIHRDCNILLGKVENYTSRQGQRMIRESRLFSFLSGCTAYMTKCYDDMPLHFRHKTPHDKLVLKYKKLLKVSKKPETKAKYKKLLQELSNV